MSSLLKILLVTLVCLAHTGCRKFLAEKPDQQLVIPHSISDLQAVLDNIYIMNVRSPSSAIAAADEYYLSDAAYNSLQEFQKRLYVWDMTYQTTFKYGNDWSYGYDAVYSCNLALEEIQKLPRTSQNSAAWDNVKGSALLFRGQAFMQLAWLYAKAYDSTTALTDPGIALRKVSDFNVPSVRANVQETYQQILADLHASISLLPPLPVFVTRPSVAAAYALLCRAHLSMCRYDSAYYYADKCLTLQHDLLDFNDPSIDLFAQKPFPEFNKEVIMHFVVDNAVYFDASPLIAFTDSTLLAAYGDNDLRKLGYFMEDPPGGIYNGMYGTNRIIFFTGPATDEMYLTRTECAARMGNVDQALVDLNTLLVTRWRTGAYIPIRESDPQQLLDIILLERRKELLFRGLRWMDIKRLNKDGANIVLTRVIGGNTYKLSPNDNRYALPLPHDVIERSGMPQNTY